VGLGGPAIAVALLVYNAIHLSLRIGLFRAGYLEGDALVPVIARLSLPVLADRLRGAAAALAGVAAAVFVVRSGISAPFAGALAALTAGLGYAALARGARLLPTAYVATLAGIGAALLFGHLHGRG
jgi:PTS system mannose-specific IID component